MRHRRLAALATALLLSAPGASAAPTCLDDNGLTIRCGVPGARPVGWAPPPDRPVPRDAPPTLAEAVAMIYLVGAIFALIALMPPFDGGEGGWDEQEGDRDRRRGAKSLAARDRRRE
jgi:hypothetical protein